MGDLSAIRLRELLDYDRETGAFKWRSLTSSKSRVKVGDVAGCIASGYWLIQVDGVLYRAHRLAWLYVHGVWPTNDLDHRDTVKHHNWIENLREATDAQNMQNNRVARRNNKCGLLGVSWNKRDLVWQSNIKVNYKSMNLGSFDDPMDAHLAYLSAKAEKHPFSTIGLRA